MRYYAINHSHDMFYNFSKLEEILYYFVIGNETRMKVSGRNCYSSAQSQKQSLQQSIRRFGYSNKIKTKIENDEVYLVKN